MNATYAPVSRPDEGGLFSAWADVVRLSLRRPSVLVPFLLLAAVELYALLLIVEAPTFFRDWLNGFISRQYGPAYVNYPAKTALLPSMFWGARIFIEVILGGLMSGWVTARVIYFRRGESLGLGGAFTVAVKRYFALAALSAIVIVAGRVATALVVLVFMKVKLPLPYGPYVFMAVTMAVVTVLSALVVFALPALIGEGRGWPGALAESARRFRRRPLGAIALVALPGFPYFLLSAAASLAPVLTQLHSPRRVVFLLAASTVAAYVARFFMVAGAAVLNERN